MADITSHIRRKAGRSLGRPFYSHDHVTRFRAGYVDPRSLTLCGEPATTADMSWAETRWAKNLAYVTCEACRAARIDQDPGHPLRK